MTKRPLPLLALYAAIAAACATLLALPFIVFWPTAAVYVWVGGFGIATLALCTCASAGDKYD